MILKFKKNLTEWIAFYRDAIKNRLRIDKNLSDLSDKDEARHNLELCNKDIKTHAHDDRYFPLMKMIASNSWMKHTITRDMCDSSGNYEWVSPITGTVHVTMVGGGAGGSVGFGGNSGDAVVMKPINVVMGERIIVTIGKGGKGASGATTGRRRIDNGGTWTNLSVIDRGARGGDTKFGSYILCKGGDIPPGNEKPPKKNGANSSAGGWWRVNDNGLGLVDSYWGGSGGSSIFGAGGIGGFAYEYMETVEGKKDSSKLKSKVTNSVSDNTRVTNSYSKNILSTPGQDAFCWGAGGGGGGAQHAKCFGFHYNWTGGIRNAIINFEMETDENGNTKLANIIRYHNEYVVDGYGALPQQRWVDEFPLIRIPSTRYNINNGWGTEENEWASTPSGNGADGVCIIEWQLPESQIDKYIASLPVIN